MAVKANAFAVLGRSCVRHHTRILHFSEQYCVLLSRLGAFTINSPQPSHTNESPVTLCVTAPISIRVVVRPALDGYLLMLWVRYLCRGYNDLGCIRWPLSDCVGCGNDLHVCAPVIYCVHVWLLSGSSYRYTAGKVPGCCLDPLFHPLLRG